MLVFGKAALIGLCIGLIWGVGCALVLLYSIYLAGYRKAVQDSFASDQPERFKKTAKSYSIQMLGRRHQFTSVRSKM
jgi:hypothetical protein